MANDKIKFSTGTVVDENGYLYQVGTQITSTAAELNLVDGQTATAAEVNRAVDISARVVTTTATALSLTVTEHAERLVVVNTADTCAISAPAAAGTGAKMTIVIGTAITQNSIVVAANGTDVIRGVSYMFGTTEEAAESFVTSATSDKYSFNGGTTGGLGGDTLEMWDVAANTWQVRVFGTGSGAIATGFAATT